MFKQQKKVNKPGNDETDLIINLLETINVTGVDKKVIVDEINVDDTTLTLCRPGFENPYHTQLSNLVNTNQRNIERPY